jgi:hypothetical protein
MKKITSFITLFTFIALTCVSCISVTVEAPAVQPTDAALPATTQPPPTLEPATPTPEIFIALTQAVPGEFQPTDSPAPTATSQQVVSTGTSATYSPLTVTIPQGIASGASGVNFPGLDGEDAAWWQKTPGHLQVSLGDYYILQGKTHQPAIYIYPASAYAEMVPAAFESIHRLQNYLYASNNVPALDQLPNVPFFNARLLFAAHIRQVSFQNGSGVRFLAEYGQSAAPANNTDLFYQFVGVTSDGAYYIVAILPISSSVLAETPDAGAPLPLRGIPYPFAANPSANMDAYYIAITDLLNIQLPGSFTPDLAELDALIQSMRIEP